MPVANNTVQLLSTPRRAASFLIIFMKTIAPNKRTEARSIEMLAVKREIEPSDIISGPIIITTMSPNGLWLLYLADTSLNEHHLDIYDSLLIFCLGKHPKIISGPR
jgi:hypothetical protein